MRRLKLLSLTSATAIAAASFAAGHANAAGFYLQEQSTSGQGNAFAGQVATPRDASIVYFNPAGMTKLEGIQMNAGVHLIMPDSDITDTGTTSNITAVGNVNGGNPYSLSPVPNFHISSEMVKDKFWLGLSLSAPFGLGNEYNDGWFGRYDSTETTLHTFDIQPSFAYKVNDALSIGGGISIQYADANLQRSRVVGLNTEATSILDGDDTSLGYNFGILYEPIEGTTLGANYRSGVHHDLKGRAEVSGIAYVPASAELDLPDIAQFGINHKINDKWSVQAGATWYGWNSFDNITVVTGSTTSTTVQNYQTTWAYGVGAEYHHSDKLTLRAGYQFDETPTTDEYRTTLTPDGDRNWFAAGATYKFNDKLSVDFAATYIDVGEETINVTRDPGATASNVVGDTDGHVSIVSLGVNYKF